MTSSVTNSWATDPLASCLTVTYQKNIMPGHHGEGCGCVEDVVGAEFLLPYIDTDGVHALNEKVRFSPNLFVFKAYSRRLDDSAFCESLPPDRELVDVFHTNDHVSGAAGWHCFAANYHVSIYYLCVQIIHVPFTTPCKLTGVHVIGGENGTHPTKVRIFANNVDDVDFNNVHDMEPIQEVELVEDFHGALEYPLKVTKLQNVSRVSLYFHGTLMDDAQALTLHYVGLRGQGSNAQRKPVVTVYESMPNRADHEVPEDSITPQFGV